MGEKERKLVAVRKFVPEFIPVKTTFGEINALNMHPAFKKLLNSEAIQPIAKIALYRLGQEIKKLVIEKNEERLTIVHALCTRDEQGNPKQIVDKTNGMVSFEFPTQEAEMTVRSQIDALFASEVELKNGKIIIEISKLPDNLLSVMDMLVLDSVIEFRDAEKQDGHEPKMLQ